MIVEGIREIATPLPVFAWGRNRTFAHQLNERPLTVVVDRRADRERRISAVHLTAEGMIGFGAAQAPPSCKLVEGPVAASGWCTPHKKEVDCAAAAADRASGAFAR